MVATVKSLIDEATVWNREKVASIAFRDVVFNVVMERSKFATY